MAQDFSQALMVTHVRVCCESICLPFYGFFMSPFPSEGCDPGMYLAVDETCLPCPANSNSTQRGESVCPCFAGYFRAAGDPPEMECTRKSCARIPIPSCYME